MNFIIKFTFDFHMQVFIPISVFLLFFPDMIQKSVCIFPQWILNQMNVSIWKLLHRLLEIGGEQKEEENIFEFLHDKEHKLDEKSTPSNSSSPQKWFFKDLFLIGGTVVLQYSAYTV